MTYSEHEARCRAMEAALRISVRSDGATSVVVMAEQILAFIGIPEPISGTGAAAVAGGVGGRIGQQ